MVATPSLIYSLPQAGPRVPRGHAGAAGNQRRLNTSQRTTSLTTTDGQMAGKHFICGDRMTLADILLYCFVEFGARVGQPINPANANIVAHHARMKARPSSAA